MTLQTIGHPFAYEMECLTRLFYPGERFAVSEQPRCDDPERILTRLSREGEEILLEAAVHLDGEALRDGERYLPPADIDWEWDAERRMSVLLFGLLCRQTGLRPPWGVLTGVRPVRLCRKLLPGAGSPEAVGEALVRDWQVLPQKAALALHTWRSLDRIMALSEPDCYSLYVSIPFCPTRCLYCSFVSHAIDRTAKLVPDYLALLCRELAETGALAKRLGLRLLSVYVGGGTPTTLDAAQLEALLGAVEENFDFTHLLEYTVEAGRPDTVSAEKFDVLKKFGVGRVSINPQTMDDTILRTIGRNHTAADIVEAMGLAKQAGFGSVNMDLIAGLPGETAESFAGTLEQVLALEPQNVTVHTLTVKRSSNLRWREDAYENPPAPIEQLLDCAGRRLDEAGFAPYYLYRQQGTRQNHENTGYSLPGHEGLYNVFSMEDRQTILAAGAGAVTKLCGADNRLERVYNYKYPYEYISGFDTILARKGAVEAFYQAEKKV